jgi:hypothetical protein
MTVRIPVALVAVFALLLGQSAAAAVYVMHPSSVPLPPSPQGNW